MATKADRTTIAIVPPPSPCFFCLFGTLTPSGFIALPLFPEYGPSSIIVMSEDAEGGDGGKPVKALFLY